jgi:hypothetical protein
VSATRIVTERNIRLLIDDNNPQQFSISSVRMAQLIQGQMQLIGQRVFLPMESVFSVTLVASTYDYTLTGVVGDIRQIIDNATGLELDQQTLDYMVQIYRQDSATSTSTGTPRDYALLETSAQLSRIRVGPTPSASGTLKVYYGIIPTSLTADSSTIPFSAPLLRGLERAVAAECVAIMSDVDRQTRMISKDSVALWQQMSEEAIRQENGRMRLMGSGTQADVMELD